MSCSKCKRSCRDSLLCEACEKREWAMCEELGKAVSQRTSDSLFNSILTPDRGFSATAATNGPSPIASALPSAKSLSETLKELDAKFASVPSRPAYLVMPPDMYHQLSVPMTMFTDDSGASSNYSSARMDFRVFQDYGVKFTHTPSILLGNYAASDVPVRRVVWKDIQSPAKPSALIWCVVVAFLCWLLCAASGLM